MKYVFGPVPSRRLGRSLGIDPIPLKTCNWNCVYCQLGRSHPLVNERKEYVPTADLLAEVRSVLDHIPADHLDWVTFVGSGEPTLHSELGVMIRAVKEMTDLPVAVITNGANLFLVEVQNALMKADLVLPSLDVGTADMYRKLIRAHPGVPFERYVQGLITFAKDFPGKFWIEVMLMQDLNDSEEDLQTIAQILRQIQPDTVHISLPTRPPVEEWVKPAGQEGLLRARTILGEVAEIVHPEAWELDLSGHENAKEAVASIVIRHPIPRAELQKALSNDFGDRGEVLDQLLEDGMIKIVERYGIPFVSGFDTYFPADTGITIPDVVKWKRSE